MAIKPKPFKKVCTQCGWSKVYTPKSDCVDSSWGFMENKCQQCGYENLVRKEIGIVGDALDLALKIFGGKNSSASYK